MMSIQKCRKALTPLRGRRRSWNRFAIEALEVRRLLSSVVVTTSGDNPTHSGVTIRDAVATANADAKAGTSDTITFAASLNGVVIELLQGPLVLGQNGAGSGTITIDGGNQVAIGGNSDLTDFQVDAGVKAVLTNLVITEGYAPSAGMGGGIYNSGTLTLTNCDVRTNNADSGGGGVYNNGTLTATGTTFFDNFANSGAAIFNNTSHKVTLTNCTFNQNTGGDTSGNGDGGAIYNFQATLTASGCTFSSNTAPSGGAIANLGGTATVSTSTFSQNSQTGDATNDGGGAIYSDDMLTLSGCTFSGNTGVDGGAIQNNGTLTASGNTFSQNSAGFGGAVYNDAGVATMSGSTFFGNFTGGDGGGGAIEILGGAVTVTTSTFSTNSSPEGGGISILSGAGGVTVSNSTFWNNSALGGGSGGAIYNDGTLTVSNSTIYGNTSNLGEAGGIEDPGTLTLTNTIVAGNSAESYTRDVDGALQPASSFNFIGTDNGITGISNSSGGNQISIGNPIDPLVGTLAYLGAAVPTLPLLTGSTAINAGGAITSLTSSLTASATSIPVGLASAIASTPGSYVIQIDSEQILVTNVSGNNLTVTRGYNGTTAATHSSGAAVSFPTDERGQARVGTADIGAYEATPTVYGSEVVTTAADTLPYTGISLREAVARADIDAANGHSDTITFASALNQQTITIAQAPIQLAGISGVITIAGANQITLSGNNTSGILLIADSVQASLTGLTFTAGGANGGPAIDSSGILAVGNCGFTDNVSGGAIDNGGTLTVNSSDFIANSSGDNGGAISAATVQTITNSTFIDNSSTALGGALSLFGTSTVSGCTFQGNSAEDGGAIYSEYGFTLGLTLTNSTFSGNTAYYGGAIDADLATISNCNFTSNSSNSTGGSGGGIESDGAMTLSNCGFFGNSAFNGGGVYNNYLGTLTVSNCTFSQNSDQGNGGSGGGIYNDNALATVYDSTFSGNSAQDGGGIYSQGTFQSQGLTLDNSTLSGNSASDGGGIYTDGSFTLTHTTVSANTASNEGGGIYQENTTDGPLALYSSIVAANTTLSSDPDISGTVLSSSSYNLIGDGTGMSGITNGDSNGNLVGTSSSPISPQLNALGYNGDALETMPLQPTSPARDEGGNLTALTASVTNAATTIPVGIPSAIARTVGAYVIRIDNEQMLVTNVDLTNDNFTVVRGYNGTAPTSHSSGANVYFATDETGATRDASPDIGASEYQANPFSTVAALPATEGSTSFLVTWSGHPATTGAAIASYTEYVSDNGGAYTAWQTNTTAPAANFTGVVGHTYNFYSVATDVLGDPQNTPTIAQATTTVVAPVAPAITSADTAAFTFGFANSFTVTASGSPAPVLSETGTLPAGLTFNSATGVLSGMPASGKTGVFTLTFGASNGVGTPASQSVTLTIAKDTSTTTLTKSTTSAVAFGQSVTFTARVTPGGSPDIYSTGIVTFKDGSTTIGTEALQYNIATFTTTSLSVGSHSISAVYAGDVNFTGSTSSALTQTVTGAAATTTKLAKNTTAPITYGQSVTFTATVSSGSGTPSGTVTFMDGSSSLGTAAVIGGVATLTTTTIPAGSNTIDAVYSGNSNFATSTSGSVSQTVHQANTTTTLTKSTTAAITYGQSVTFTAKLAAVSPGAGTPTGSVNFMDGSTSLGTAAVSGGVAKLTTTTIPAGSNSITAVYSGDNNFTTSTSGSLSQTVNKASTTTKLTKSTTTAITYGQSVTLTATLSIVSPGAGTPTGTVNFMDGSTSLGTAAVSGGVATLTTTTIPAGSNSITAIYSGDNNFATSTSGSVSQTVHQATTTKLTKNTTAPITSGQSVTFTATLAAVSPGAGTPTGTINFMDNGSSIGTATLSAGVAMLMTTTLPVGSNSITAVYSGDTDFTTSTSSALSQTVNS